MELDREEQVLGQQLSRKLRLCAGQYGMDESIGNYIFNNFIRVLPRQDIEKLNVTDASQEPANVMIELKKAVTAGFKIMEAIYLPDYIFDYMHILMAAVAVIKDAELPEKTQVYVMYQLHVNNAYDKGISRDQLICEIQQWYENKNGRALGLEAVERAVNRLLAMKVIYTERTLYRLNDRIWGRLK